MASKPKIKHKNLVLYAIVHSFDHEGCDEPAGLFSTFELAQAYLDGLEINSRYEDWSIVELTVDALVKR